MKRLIITMAMAVFLLTTTGCATTTAADKKPKAEAPVVQSDRTQEIDVLIKHYRQRAIEIEKDPVTKEYTTAMNKINGLVKNSVIREYQFIIRSLQDLFREKQAIQAKGVNK